MTENESNDGGARGEHALWNELRLQGTRAASDVVSIDAAGVPPTVATIAEAVAVAVIIDIHVFVDHVGAMGMTASIAKYQIVVEGEGLCDDRNKDKLKLK